jgi:hypothetical protein
MTSNQPVNSTNNNVTSNGGARRAESIDDETPNETTPTTTRAVLADRATKRWRIDVHSDDNVKRCRKFEAVERPQMQAEESDDGSEHRSIDLADYETEDERELLESDTEEESFEDQESESEKYARSP